MPTTGRIDFDVQLGERGLPVDVLEKRRQIFKNQLDSIMAMPEEQQYNKFMRTAMGPQNYETAKQDPRWFDQYEQIRNMPTLDTGGMGGLFGGSRALGWKAASRKFSGLWDRQPRFEIDDSLARIKTENLERNRFIKDQDIYQLPIGMFSDKPKQLKDVLHHPEFFKHYPEAGELPVSSTLFDFFTLGAYDPVKKRVLLQGGTPDRLRDVLLHELQHYIQFKEGFAIGGNIAKHLPPNYKELTEQLNNKLRPVEESIKQKFPDYNSILMDFAIQTDALGGRIISPSTQKMLNRIKKLTEYPELVKYKLENAKLREIYNKAVQRYKMTAGEVEAEAPSFRREFTPEQRTATTPISTEHKLNELFVDREPNFQLTHKYNVQQLKKQMGGE